MAIDLVKSESRVLPIKDSIITLSFEWEHVVVNRVPIDCDLSVVMLGGENGGRMITDRGLVFYNNPTSEDGSVIHRGDAIEGGGSDEAEVIEVHLARVHHDIQSLEVYISIYDHEARDHKLGNLTRATFRVRRGSGGATLYRQRVPLPDPPAGASDACRVGTFDRTAQGWNFEAEWDPFEGGLEQVIADYRIV